MEGCGSSSGCREKEKVVVETFELTEASSCDELYNCDLRPARDAQDTGSCFDELTSVSRSHPRFKLAFLLDNLHKNDLCELCLRPENASTRRSCANVSRESIEVIKGHFFVHKFPAAQ